MSFARSLAAGLLALAMLIGAKPAVAVETGFLDRTVVLHGVTYRYQVYVPLGYRADRKWPVALFLHGSGERGEDGSKQAEVGLGAAIRFNRDRFPMIAVMPQARENTRWNGEMADMAMQALEQSIVEFHGDRQRVYLTGLSMGGQGTWLLAASHPHTFAAIAPVCGFLLLKHDDDVLDPVADARLLKQFPEALAGDPSAAFARRIGKLPVWIFHGEVDDVVPVENARRMAVAMQAIGAEVRFNEYAGVNHGAWDRAYGEPDLVPWLLSHRLDRAPPASIK